MTEFSAIQLQILYEAFIPYVKRQLTRNKKGLEQHKINQITVEHHEKIYREIYEKLKPYEDHVAGGIEG